MAEDRRPPAALWEQRLVSSRLLQYEVWNRLHARGFDALRQRTAGELIERIDLVELAPAVLERALQPFPLHVRTSDALHLASMHFVRSLGQPVELASYDERLIAAAKGIGIGVVSV